MQTHLFLCFGASAEDGNPALVVEGDPSTPTVRQAFAREHNLTCVWIDPCGEAGVAAVIDYFYPHTRSPLCLHATLAAAQHLFQLHGVSALVVKTALHGQRLGLSAGDDQTVFVRLQAEFPPQPELTPELVGTLLNAPELRSISAPRVASVGSPKLLVEVADAATLARLSPDLAAIVRWGKTAGVNGLYAYCRLADGTFEGRNFNHLDPALEDRATGVAAGALTALLSQEITLRQGHTCLMRTRIDGADIFVGGRAQLASLSRR